MSFQKIDNSFLVFGEIVSHEVSELLKQNSDLFGNVIPIGEIAPILTNIPGVPSPNPNLWQECNGSEIVNPNSPLRSIGTSKRYTPDLTSRYLKCPTNPSLSGQTGGYNTLNFAHNHTGYSGYNDPAKEDGDPSKGEYQVEKQHRHQILTSFSNDINVEPPYITVKWYMRIQ